jgi:hypothetical protein
MDSIQTFIRDNWFGIFSLIVGFIISYYFYKRSLKEPKLISKYRSLSLIGGFYQELPEEVEVLINGINVNRLTKTKIAIWNYGTSTLKGDSVYKKDPFRIIVNEDVKIIVSPKVILTTNNSPVGITPHNSLDNEYLITFDFLKPNDGFLFEFLHTGDQDVPPNLKGTFINLEKGIEFGGDLYKQESNRILDLTKKIIYHIFIWGFISFCTFLVIYNIGTKNYLISFILSPVLLLVYWIIILTKEDLKEKRLPYDINKSL